MNNVKGKSHKERKADGCTRKLKRKPNVGNGYRAERKSERDTEFEVPQSLICEWLKEEPREMDVKREEKGKRKYRHENQEIRTS